MGGHAGPLLPLLRAGGSNLSAKTNLSANGNPFILIIDTKKNPLINKKKYQCKKQNIQVTDKKTSSMEVFIPRRELRKQNPRGPIVFTYVLIVVSERYFDVLKIH